MKLLVVIGLVALLVFLLYRRLRPYLRFVREIFNTLRHFRNITAQTGERQRPGSSSEPEKLVCCEGCGTWIPAGRALRGMSAGAIYCSADCVGPKIKAPKTTQTGS